MKKLLSSLLALCMTLSLAVLPASALELGCIFLGVPVYKSP